MTKRSLIVLLLWIAAPVAWYMMWRDKKYHSWFPHLLWINGAVFGIITIFRAQHVLTRGPLTPLLISAALVFALFQVVVGLRMKEETAQKYIIPIIIAFFIDIGLGYFYVII